MTDNITKYNIPESNFLEKDPYLVGTILLQ